MQFGWLTLGHSSSAAGDHAMIHEQIEQACFAETAGFDGIWLTEHNFYGTVERVAEQVAALREAGVGHVLCQMTSGELPHARALASMQRFGERVMPCFR